MCLIALVFCESLPHMWPGCNMVLRPYVTVGMFCLCFVPYAPLCESGIWSRGGYFAYFRKKKTTVFVVKMSILTFYGTK